MRPFITHFSPDFSYFFLRTSNYCPRLPSVRHHHSVLSPRPPTIILLSMFLVAKKTKDSNSERKETFPEFDLSLISI